MNNQAPPSTHAAPSADAGPSAGAVEQPGIPADHFVLAIGLAVKVANGVVDGEAAIRPEFFAPGTRLIRTGVLLTMLDIVGGHVPVEAINPTVDLRLQIVGPVPDTGVIRLHGRPLRVGRRLVVAETSVSGEDGVEFARGFSTFINRPVGSDLLLAEREPAPIAEGSIDGLLAARHRGPMALEVSAVPRISNGPQGTIQGGAQAVLAELAVEHALGGGQRVAVTDLDIRYLDRVRVGPLVATVEQIGPPGGDRLFARVALTDAGDSDRLISYAAITAVAR